MAGLLNIVVALTVVLPLALSQSCAPPAGTVYDLLPDPYLAKDPNWPGNQPFTANDIPITYNMQSGTLNPEQVGIFPASRDLSYFHVQWTIPTQIPNVEGTLTYGTSATDLSNTVRVTPTSYEYAIGSEGAYRSGQIYTALVGPVLRKTQYFFKIGTYPKIWNFTTLPAVGSSAVITIGLIADVGQTFNSSITFDHVTAAKNDLVLFGADLSYSDNYEIPCTPYNGTDLGYATCGMGGLREDSLFRLAEKMTSTVPTAFVSGNHELQIEPKWGVTEPYISYNARVPSFIDDKTAFTSFASYVNLAKLPGGGRFPARSQHFYSMDVGSVHVIGLASFVEYVIYTNQWWWLRDDLCSINNTLTPWKIVLLHQPWYNTDKSHYMEGEGWRYLVEPWFYNATIDLVAGGHVHAYERSYPVYNYRLDTCGPVHVTVGDGGNDEGIAGPFLYPQPAYSAYREYSFGRAQIEFTNANSATYTWYRNQDGVSTAGDSFTLANKNAACGPKKPSFCPN